MRGITRGASKQEVYDGTRLISANVTRLFIDAQTPQQWREKEFHAVINEGQSNSLGNLENSLIAGMLALKRLHPMPAGRRLPDNSFDLKLNRDQQCAQPPGVRRLHCGASALGHALRSAGAGPMRSTGC